MLRRRGLGRALLGIVLSSLLAASVGMPAAAAPKYPDKDDVSQAEKDADDSANAAAKVRQKVAAAQARLTTLDTEVEKAVEAYNGAIYKLGKAKKSYRSAKDRAAESVVAVERARRGVAAVASGAYMGSDTGEYVALFGAEDPGKAVDGATMLGALSEQRSGTYDRLEAAEVVRDIVRKQAKRALTKQRKQTRRVAATKKAAQQKLATQQSVLNRVASLQQKLADQAAEDARAANQLAEQRRAGIAEERRVAAAKARRQAAEARQRAAAAAAARDRQQQDDGPDRPDKKGGGGDDFDPQATGGSPGKVAVRFAKAQIGKPYVWAADGPDSYDCSGLTMRAWQKAGRSLPHYSVAQWDQTARVSLSNLRKGDLVFFADNTNNPSTIHHVGIYSGGGKMVEAPYTGAHVRIASIYRDGLIGAGRP